MDGLTLFGLVAVTSMVTLYAFESRHHLFTLGFAAACLAASIYGFAAGTWPFGVVEAVWTIIALVKWHRRMRQA